jgi:hypothetical protein
MTPERAATESKIVTSGLSAYVDLAHRSSLTTSRQLPVRIARVKALLRHQSVSICRIRAVGRDCYQTPHTQEVQRPADDEGRPPPPTNLKGATANSTTSSRRSDIRFRTRS